MGVPGKHVAGRTDVHRTDSEISAWKRTAKLARAENLAAWIRATLNAAAAAAGVRVAEPLDEVDED